MTHLLRRIFVAVITVWAIATICFFLLHLLPGNPFGTTHVLGVQMQNRLNAYYGLDRPLSEQYIRFLRNLMHGDFGYSYRYPGQTVNSVLTAAFPVSMQLGLSAYALSFPIGLVLGILTAERKNSAIDTLCVTLSALIASAPLFILSSLMQYWFAIRFHIFSITGWNSVMEMVLPIASLALGLTAVKFRTMRTLTLEILHEDYILAAKARGIPSYRILLNYVTRNAIIPVLSSVGMEITSAMMGSFVVEQIFNIPGIGRYFVDSVQNRDYTMTLGITIFFSSVLVMMNLCIDAVYFVVDPRIRVTE